LMIVRVFTGRRRSKPCRYRGSGSSGGLACLVVALLRVKFLRVDRWDDRSGKSWKIGHYGDLLR
jgi:hypothetical protein